MIPARERYWRFFAVVLDLGDLTVISSKDSLYVLNITTIKDIRTWYPKE